MSNKETYIKKLDKFRDPKNHNSDPVDGSLYTYEVKKLEYKDLKEYLELYYQIYSDFFSYDLEMRNETFIKFVKRDFVKYRPKREHEEILGYLDSITSKKTTSFVLPNFSSTIQNHIRNVFIILLSTYFLSSFSGTWDGVGIPFTVLSFLIFIFAGITIFSWYKLNKKNDLKNSEKNILIYTTTILVALLMTLIIVSPYESSGPEITCYKLANGETTCFSEREYEEWLDKYRN